MSEYNRKILESSKIVQGRSREKRKRRFAMLTLIFSLVLFLLAGSESFAQTYRYTDEKGVVHFTDTPTDRNYKGPAAVPQAEKGFQNDEAPFYSLKKRIMEEVEDPRRPAWSKEDICFPAIELIDRALRLALRKNEREFLESVENAVFNRKVDRGLDGKDYISYPGSSLLLEKARILMGIPENESDRNRKMMKEMRQIPIPAPPIIPPPIIYR